MKHIFKYLKIVKKKNHLFSQNGNWKNIQLIILLWNTNIIPKPLPTIPR